MAAAVAMVVTSLKEEVAATPAVAAVVAMLIKEVMETRAEAEPLAAAETAEAEMAAAMVVVVAEAAVAVVVPRRTAGKAPTTTDAPLWMVTSYLVTSTCLMAIKPQVHSVSASAVPRRTQLGRSWQSLARCLPSHDCTRGQGPLCALSASYRSGSGHFLRHARDADGKPTAALRPDQMIQL